MLANESERTKQNLHSAVDLGQITIGDHLRWLVTDTNLETSWAPVNELNSTFGLESSDSSVNILRDDITTVQQASSHILSVARITFDHLVVRFEARHGDLLDRVGFVGCLCGRNDWGVCNEREMDTWVWDQVGLELVEIDVEGTIETEGGSDRGDNYFVH